jgi:hypothetical protein
MLLHLMHDWAVRREPWQVPRPNPPTRACAACADPAARWLRVALEGRLLPQLADGRREAAALGRVIVLAAAAGRRTVSR